MFIKRYCYLETVICQGSEQRRLGTNHVFHVPFILYTMIFLLLHYTSSIKLFKPYSKLMILYSSSSLTFCLKVSNCASQLIKYGDIVSRYSVEPYQVYTLIKFRE